MTFLASVAAGHEAVESLWLLHEKDVRHGRIRFVRCDDLAVAFAAGSPWIDTHDDGDHLVVLDGRIHDVAAQPGSQAQFLLERYREVGTTLASGLLGDFVFVVLDRNTHTLLVARDPIGVRPWYLASTGGRLAGASDVATLASLPWVDSRVNEPAAIEYLAARAESRGATLYRGVSTLRPGETAQAGEGGARTFRHHDWNFRPDLGISWQAAGERCRELLDEAVVSRLKVAGPATCELSGGLDSSSVVGTVAKLGRDDLMAGRLVFATPRADERGYSQAVIDHWGIAAVSTQPWIPSEEESLEMTRRLKRPLPDPHFTMFASLKWEMLGLDRLQALTGLGGDDAFLTSKIGSRVASAVRLRQGSVILGFVRDTVGHPVDGWRRILRPTLHHLAPWKGDRVPPWLSARAVDTAGLNELARRAPEPVTRISAIDQRIDNITSGYDAWILEARAVVSDETGTRDSHPFLDPRFIEATYTLDPSWPTLGGHTRALEVEAFRDRLPPAVAARQNKADFSEVFWPQLLNPETLHSLRTGPLADSGWLDDEGMRVLLDRARQDQPNAAIPLSRCVAVDRWLRSL